jgi:hypothetical protein
MSIVQVYQCSLLNNITLLGAHVMLDKIGPLNLIILRWLYLGLSQIDIAQGHLDFKSRLLWELICVLHFLQTTQMHMCAYILEDGSPLGNSQPTNLVRCH